MPLLAIWRIDDLGVKAINRDFYDVSAQAIYSMKTIGVLAIQKSNGDGLASDKILNIGLLGAGKANWFITACAFNGLKELLLMQYQKESIFIVNHLEFLSI